MSLFTMIKLAFRTLMANKLRAFLTMIGISIGVGAVIALLSIGTGVQKLHHRPVLQRGHEPDRRDRPAASSAAAAGGAFGRKRR